MALTGNESEVITLQEATALTTNYQAANNGPIAHFFGKEKIREILDQEDCAGIRIYYGLNEDGVKQLVAVGVTYDENELYNGGILDKAVPCPSCCSPSPLNGL